VAEDLVDHRTGRTGEDGDAAGLDPAPVEVARRADDEVTDGITVEVARIRERVSEARIGCAVDRPDHAAVLAGEDGHPAGHDAARVDELRAADGEVDEAVAVDVARAAHGGPELIARVALHEEERRPRLAGEDEDRV